MVVVGLNKVNSTEDIYCILLLIDKVRVKGIHIYGCRCNERLKIKTEGSTRLTYTGLCGERGYLHMETMLKDERFESVRGVSVI